MRCPDVRMELQSFVDRDLNLDQSTLVERHMAGCDDCRAELARLQAVMGALESWPLVVEPDDFTACVMTQVRRCTQHIPLPPFRIRWNDLALSLAGASLTFAAMLGWRYLSSTDLAHLWGAQAHLRLEMLRLEALLWAHHLSITSAIPWGLVFVGLALVSVLALAAWELGVSYPVTGGARSAHS